MTTMAFAWQAKPRPKMISLCVLARMRKHNRWEDIVLMSVCQSVFCMSVCMYKPVQLSVTNSFRLPSVFSRKLGNIESVVNQCVESTSGKYKVFLSIFLSLIILTIPQP